MPVKRTTSAGRTALEVDGVMCGFVQSVAGGAITAEVVTTRGQGVYDEKHLGPVEYEAFELQVDLSFDKLVYDWIEASWQDNYSRRDGSIVATDFAGKAVSEQEFFRGLITEVGVPALDAASKDLSYLSLRIAPEYTRLKKSTSKTVKTTVGRQKEWRSSNFKLEIDGLDATKVSKIEAFTVTQTVVRDDVGETRDIVSATGKLQFPNLRITLAATGAGTWTDWFDDFVVKGNNDASKERKGTLTFLSTDLKTRLGAVSFFNLGIFRLEPERHDANVEQVARVVADLYCERMELTVP